MRLYGVPLYPDRINLLVVAVLYLVLIEAPRDVTLQLASASLPTATGVIARWLLMVTGC
jgi:hypothetical protein